MRECQFPAALLLFCGFGLTIGSLVLLRYAVKSTRDVVYAMGVGLFFPIFFAGVLLTANFAFGVPFPFQVTAPCLAMPDRRSAAHFQGYEVNNIEWYGRVMEGADVQTNS